MIKDYADKKRRKQLRSFFTLVVFCILFATFVVLIGSIYILMYLDILHIQAIRLAEWFLPLLFMVASLLIGTILTLVISRFVLKAINSMADGMSALARGDFDVRLDLGKNEEVKKLSDSFNSLAEELQGIQMLRSNFVNEYAHEFKTPIVSIKGFAELLQQDDLSEKQRKEYLSVIIEEAERLSVLSLNSLNLSKIENQRILTGKVKFNISEQIRRSILLLEKKWMSKNIEFEIDLDEVNILANEEMLKQVWINLMDNAIKFSNENGKIKLELKEQDDVVKFVITNSGRLTTEQCQKVFDKFYKVNNTNQIGHGVGLAIVKKIIELHNGNITVASLDNSVVFTVSLPRC